MFHNRHDGERNQPLLPSGCTSYLRKVPMGISFTSPSMAAIRSDQIHMICHDKSDIHMIYGETKVLEIEDRRDRRHRGIEGPSRVGHIAKVHSARPARTSPWQPEPWRVWKVWSVAICGSYCLNGLKAQTYKSTSCHSETSLLAPSSSSWHGLVEKSLAKKW